MTTTPTGAPAWSRTASHDVYGGHVDKVDFQSQGLVNAQTDVGAAGFARLCADAASFTLTAAFCTLTVTCNDSGPGAPVIEAVHQMTGIRLASYIGDAPPAGFPSGARNGDGDVTLTWAASYTDAYGVSQATNIKNPETTYNGAIAVAATPEVVSAVAVRVRCRNFPGGTNALNAKFTLTVS